MASKKYTYLGPYDEFYPEGRGGKVLRPGDTYSMTEEQKASFGVSHRWADESGEPEAVDPLIGTAFQKLGSSDVNRETGSAVTTEETQPEEKK